MEELRDKTCPKHPCEVGQADYKSHSIT